MKVSIITVCYNSAKTIKDTIESVLNQTYDNIEYIIVDGKSNDNTVSIIEKYSYKFKNKIKFISEKDNGLYDAMNKGIKMATGDIIGILNSDDIFANDNVIKTIVNVFSKSDCDVTYSNLLYMDSATMKIPVRKFIANKPSKKFGWHPPHPTLYLKRCIYDEIGLFNKLYNVTADYDFMIRLLKQKKYKFEYINEYLVYMRYGGLSTNGIKGYSYNFKESYLVLKSNNIKFPFLLNCIRSIKTIFQIIHK